MDVVVGKDVSFGQLHFGSAALGDALRLMILGAQAMWGEKCV